MAEKTTTEAPAAAPTEKPPVPQAALPKGGPNEPKTKTQDYPIGIGGAKIEDESRTVPGDEAPPLPINEKLAIIGKPTPRLDGRAKVTGAAKYTADVNLPGMLFAKLVTSTVPHAIVKSIDTSAAEKHPAFRAIHMLDRDRSAAQTEEEKKDKWPRVRYVGQPLGAIAAPTQAQADEIARRVKITYEQKPFVVDPDKAKEPNA